MASATTVPRLTYDDLDLIPQERAGDRHELFDGVLIVTPSPIPHHQIVSGNAYSLFDRVIRPNDLGQLFTAPIDVKFAPRAVTVPDLVFVGRDRLHIVGPKAIEGVPDLVVEILSPSTRRRDLGRKRGLYERFGVREYWIVDPKARALTVFVLEDGQYRPLSIVNGVVRSTVVPGLVVDVASLFVGLPHRPDRR